MARRVLMADVSGGWVRSRLRLGWMNGVKVALGGRGMTVHANNALKMERIGEPWCICRLLSFVLPLFLGPALW